MSTQTDTAFEAAVEAALGQEQAARGDTTQEHTGAPETGAEQLTPLGRSLRTALDGTFRDVRRDLRAMLTGGDFLRDPSLSVPEARAWTSNALQGIVDAGHGGAGFPTSVGGDGLVASSVVNFEMLALADLSLTVKVGVHFGLFGGAISNLGTEEQIQEFVPQVMSLHLPGCFAMTEVGHGSDVQALETTLTYDADTDEIVVHSPGPSATKTYIGNAAADGRMAAVFGQLEVAGTNHGIHVVLVPLRDDSGDSLPGVTIGDNGAKGGLDGVDNGTLSFDQIRVPRTMLLSRYGGVTDEGTYESPIDNPNRRFFTMLGTLVRGRICVGGAAAQAARKALSIATRYSLQRRQFEAPGREDEVLLLDYLAHQRKLLPAIATAYALSFAQNELVDTLQSVQSRPVGERDQKAQRELETRAAGLKAVSTRFANDTIQVCREACGGAGYMAENGLTELRRDADVFATFEGDNTVLLQLVAKGLLTNYKAMWGDLDMLGMVQAAARTFTGTVIERTAARPAIERIMATAQRKSDSETVLERSWHVTMFEEREQHVLDSLAQRLRTAGQDESRAFEAFNATQDHQLLAARTHMDRVVLEAFIAGIEACEDEATAAVLNKLCDLYVLENLAGDRGWFQEHGRMSTVRAKAIVPALNQLCQELRPLALPLVEGMGVPEQLLQSAMLED
ncbi:acyl-CoA dehydrogenase family protein [Ornithinimicrobium sp. F0845]|uniref:acyl-CoA dehydrogenase family protein n=1 Tax=Ornithinimicrobium sp. F0845 TaxID=2926412 RepID=UPI001FF6A7DD|nr:acyl-CoA dehydrogenase [Ornithinimicrobium sp. F0845]MCK0110914.1 acyl-CoA dehydrogenase family protein [Ornithinimicrobium sp. F0845]